MQHHSSIHASILLGAALALCFGLSAGLAPSTSAGEAPQQRVPGTIEIQGSPDGIEKYVIVEAFPNLRFDRPIWIGHAPDGGDYLWVMEQGGLIKVFENDRDVKKATVALDLRKQILRSHAEEGLLSMAFSPQFKSNKTVFIAYSAGNPRRLLVSRFETSGTRRRIRSNTEALVLRQRQPYGNHNGGCLAFGPDGYLYVSVGDGGSFGDPDNQAQNLENWLGSILRVEVVGKKGFTVPPDNPLVGVQHARPEIWAYGFQNVRRFSFDRLTGDLWAGDVGNAKLQEINLVKRGCNYGWSLREGKEQFKEGRSLVPLEDPLLALASDEASRIIGGQVYRGKRMPDLIGAYVFGDLGKGNLWALRSDGKEIKENLLIGRGRGITSFGDDKDGEIFITSFDGKIHTLAPWTGHKPKGRFPRRLSDTGLIKDMLTLEPHPSMVPYSINMPLWNDGAHKRRYVMLPGTKTIKVAKDGSFEFPVGTIFMKHFYIGEESKGPLPGSRLETRLFLRRPRGWAGYTYVWDSKQEEAILLDGRLDQRRVDASTADKTVHWTFPSRSDCMSCHTEAGGRVLGFRIEQINRMHDYGGKSENQIDVFNRLGFFDGTVGTSGKPWPDCEDEKADLDTWVRAYMDVACAMCHQPDGPGNALIDLRFETKLKDSNLLNRRPGQWNLDVYNGRLLVPGNPKRSLLYVRLDRTDELGMPPVAHNMPDKVGMAKIEKWILGLK